MHVRSSRALSFKVHLYLFLGGCLLDWRSIIQCALLLGLVGIFLTKLLFLLTLMVNSLNYIENGVDTGTIYQCYVCGSSYLLIKFWFHVFRREIFLASCYGWYPFLFYFHDLEDSYEIFEFFFLYANLRSDNSSFFWF